MKLHFVLGVLGFVTLSSPVFAAAEILQCKFTGENVWVPDLVVLEVDADAQRAIVFDPIIKHFIGEPIAGKISTDNAKRTTYVWTVKNVKDGHGNQASLQYRLTVMKADHKASVTAQALGYIGPFTGRGACTKG